MILRSQITRLKLKLACDLWENSSLPTKYDKFKDEFRTSNLIRVCAVGYKKSQLTIDQEIYSDLKED